MVGRLKDYLDREPHSARAASREICGEILLFTNQTGKFLIAKLRPSEMFLRAVVGSEGFVVAETRFAIARPSLM
jgi:hypothetical protein